MLVVGLGRVVQDLLLWCTMEFGYLRLSDGFVQGSSIMPQKRNPVALEHARAIGSKAVGQAQAIVTAVHNTPFGDIVDTEDDLQPLIASMFRDATRMVTLVAAAMRLADFDTAKLASRAAVGGTTLTELADTLVRDHGLSFRSAHAIAALLLKARTEDPQASLADDAFESIGGDSRQAARVFRGGPRNDHEPSAFRAGAHHARWSRSLGDRPRHWRVTAQAANRSRSVGAAVRAPFESRVAARRPRQSALMKSTYVRVVIVWVVTLAALYAFQWFYALVERINDMEGRRIVSQVPGRSLERPLLKRS